VEQFLVRETAKERGDVGILPGDMGEAASTVARTSFRGGKNGGLLSALTGRAR
jgi:hypothetical protein